jgi:tetratricopeptide (TPR) repeat protein
MRYGLALWAQSKFDSSINVVLKAERLALSLNLTKSLSDIYVQLSAIESQRGHYKSSIEYSKKGLPIWQDPRTFSVGASSAIAFIYNSVGDYETSLQYYRDAVRMLHAKGVAYNRTLYTFMGETYFLAQKYDSAAYCYTLGMQHINREGNSAQRESALRETSWFDSRMAEVHMANGAYTKAIELLIRSMNGFESRVDNNQLMWVLNRLMNAYDRSNNPRAAMRYAYKLLRMSTTTGARQHARDANLMLSRLFDRQHNVNSAYQYLKEYRRLKEVIDSDLTQQRLAVFKTQLEQEKLRSSLEKSKAQQRLAVIKSQLEQEKLRASLEKNQIKLRQATTQRIYLAAGLLLVIAIGITAFRNVSLRRKAQHQRLESVQNELRMQKVEGDATKAALLHRATDLEMQALRSQMNPHFLFNSLNSINRYILTNDKVQASEYLTTFSKLVRLILTNSRSPLISLESELEGLTLYLQLESMRFENRFSYSITMSPELEPSELRVPPLFLQPYVENAIWHGLLHKPEPGVLEIDIRQQKDHIRFKITDNGIGRKQAARLSSKSATLHKSLGLKITADRIAYMCGDQSQAFPITIKDLVHADGTAAGTEVIVKLPPTYD